MSYLTKITSVITALFLFIGAFFSGGIKAATVPKNPENYDDTIMFVSDFQDQVTDFSGANRADHLFDIATAAKDENPGLVVGGGDYQSAFAGTFGSTFGITYMKNTLAQVWDYNLEYLLVQGNHDAPKSSLINETGLYGFAKYLIYTINEDDFPWNEQLDLGIAKNKVKETANDLSAALSALIKNGETRPVFVVSHLPLHYSSRSNGKDNRYASYILDVLNEKSSDLNIVYLYGHNHSDTYDDYIGGAINYLAKGDTIHVGGSNEEATLNFTYTNCGYIGYSGNSNSDTSTSTLTATFFKVAPDGLSLKKYSKDGVVMEKFIPAVSQAELAA